MLRNIVCLTLLVVFMMTVYAKSNRDSTLFKKYPLEKGIAEMFSELSHGEARRGLTEAALTALSRHEDKKIEELTSMEEVTVRQAKEQAKPQWFGYYYNKEIDTIFHNYESDAVVIYGTADYETVQKMLEKENYSPIGLGRSGRAIVALHIVKHADTSIGSYNEMTLTVHATPTQKDEQGREKVLGVSYQNDNTASLLYPIFGKLEDHHRHFILSSVADHGHDYHKKIHGYPTTSAKASIERMTEESEDGKTYFTFNFKQADGKTIVEGRIEEDNTWSSWAKAGYKVFRALGLSGIIDLWYAKHVPLKYASPVQLGAKVSSHFTNFKGLRIHDLKDYELKWNQNTEMGRKLESMNFKPEMVTRMPQFQSAVSVPKDQADDLDFLTTRLQYEEEDKSEL